MRNKRSHLKLRGVLASGSRPVPRRALYLGLYQVKSGEKFKFLGKDRTYKMNLAGSGFCQYKSLSSGNNFTAVGNEIYKKVVKVR